MKNESFVVRKCTMLQRGVRELHSAPVRRVVKPPQSDGLKEQVDDRRHHSTVESLILQRRAAKEISCATNGKSPPRSARRPTSCLPRQKWRPLSGLRRESINDQKEMLFREFDERNVKDATGFTKHLSLPQLGVHLLVDDVRSYYCRAPSARRQLRPETANEKLHAVKNARQTLDAIDSLPPQCIEQNQYLQHLRDIATQKLGQGGQMPAACDVEQAMESEVFAAFQHFCDERGSDAFESASEDSRKAIFASFVGTGPARAAKLFAVPSPPAPKIPVAPKVEGVDPMADLPPPSSALHAAAATFSPRPQRTRSAVLRRPQFMFDVAAKRQHLNDLIKQQQEKCRQNTAASSSVRVPGHPEAKAVAAQAEAYSTFKESYGLHRQKVQLELLRSRYRAAQHTNKLHQRHSTSICSSLLSRRTLPTEPLDMEVCGAHGFAQ